MALMDAQNLFSDAQALTVTAASTNYIDGSAARLSGNGEPLMVLAAITSVGGTSPTITAALEGADDTAFSTNKITLATVTPTLVSGTAYGLLKLAISPHAAKRYYRMYYTMGGTSPTVTITAGFALDVPTTPMT